MPRFLRVPRSSIIEPPQPLRISMDEEKLAELAASLEQWGMIHPIAVTGAQVEAIPTAPPAVPVEGNSGGAEPQQWEIIDGHRRFIASGMIGWTEVDVAVFPDVASGKFGIMLHANIMREDVTAVEEGTQFITLAQDHHWSMDELKRFFGRSESYINQRATLVSDFADVAAHVQTREITWGQAAAIMRTRDPGRRAYLLDQAVTCGLSARNLSVMVDDFKRQDALAASGAPAAPVHDITFVPAVEERECVWCGRSDDPYNLTLVNVHTYHKRDLETLIAAVGAVPPRAAQG